MGKKQGLVRTAVGPHGSENHDQTASHNSLLPFEFEPLTKKKTEKQILTDQTIPSFGPIEQADADEQNLMTFPTPVR